MGVDDWEEFVERIEFYWEANEVEEDKKKRAISLTKIDADTYSIVRKICAPKDPKDVPIKDIMEKMEKYMKPKVNTTVLRAQFRERQQKETE